MAGSLQGVRLAEEVWVIVAVGIELNGEKQVMDFEQGSSENASGTGACLLPRSHRSRSAIDFTVPFTSHT